MSSPRDKAIAAGWRAGRVLVGVLAAAVLVFNLGVLLVVFLSSLSKTRFLAFPPEGLTWSWYGELDRYRDSVMYSLRVAVVAATLAVVLGTLASIALLRSNLRFKQAILTFFLAPLIVPSSVFALAILVVLVKAGRQPDFWPLTLGLAVHGAPFCIRIVLSGLQNIDWQLEAAARTLGASRRRAWLRVLLPIAAPSVAAGWMFSFIFAFDDSTISIFLARPTKQTYGAQLLSDMDDFVTPGVAAAASAVIGVTILGVAVLGLIFAFQRRVFGSSGGARAFAGAPAPAADRATVAA
jgi:ABC-type spermidine/putrescine transport system permease subunit II